MHDPLASMPAVLDRQIDSEDKDAFGHRHFSQALRSLVESEHHKPPFSIGLLGGWGTGKSSIKELYTRGLEDDATLNERYVSRKDRYKSITFNAWRFGGKDQDIKRALLRHVFLELDGDENALHDRLFRNVTQSEQQWKGWGEYTAQLWRAWAMPLPAFLIAMVGLLFFIWVGLKILPADGTAAQTMLSLVIGYAYSYLLKQLKPSKIDSFRSITKVSLPSASAEQYEEMLLAQLKVFKGTTKGILSKANTCERLVIFVDDLDRLSAEEMVLGLDAVRAFMEIPAEKLPEGLGLVFVISCDEAKVADALARGRSNNPEQPGTVFTHKDARRYLDRIFQFRLEIPPPPRSDMRQFALSHLSCFEEIIADLKGRGTSPEQLIDRMIHVNVVDPRNALQIVNAFAQSWWLARRREREGDISERPGGLHREAVTGHPVSLAALSAAKVSFPDFYRDLQDDPQLLGRLTSILVHEVSVLEFPADLRPLLVKRYVTFDDDGKGGGTTKIRENCRELRQFLSSLVGIRWPDSLQSLLLLSEDPISRKFGAGTSVIYGLLMSGDVRGVIEHLSPRADKVVLNDNQAHLLHQMVSDLYLETVSRRHNALRVIASLINDLPERTKRLVLGPLCTELAGSSTLRSMIGVSKIAAVMVSASRADQRQVAGALVDDLCTTGQPFGLTLANMQTPSLDDAKSMAEKAMEIILVVREEHGLPPTQDRKFVKWLEERSITVGGKAYSFPFSTLESWISDHETMLMKALGTEYLNLLGNEVESGRSQEIDMERVVPRVTELFETLAQAGEESREDLWELVESYLMLPDGTLRSCAFAVIEQHQKLMSSEASSSCLETVAKLLIEQPDTEIDFDRGLKWVMQSASSRFDELDDEARECLVALAKDLPVDDYEADAVSLYEGIIQRDNSLLASVAESWAQSLSKDLPLLCCAAMFRSYDRLPAAVKASIANQLESGSSGSPLSERFSEVYPIAASEIPGRYWKEPELQAHLNAAMNRLPSMLSRGEADLKALLPGLTQVYRYGEPSTVGTCLRDTFRTGNSYPAMLNLLHQFFALTWPTAENAPGYVPQTIFTDAISTMTSYPAEAKTGVLRSLQSLIDEGLVDPAQQNALTALSCATWQTHPVEAEWFLANSNATFTGAQVAALPNAIQWDNDKEVARLAAVWRNLAAKLSAEEQVAATSLILNKAQAGDTEVTDQCLTLWSTCLGTKAYSTLKRAIGDAATDDGRRRLWRQIISSGIKPGDMELLKVALPLLEISDSPQTASSVLEELKAMTGRVSSQSERHHVAEVLLKQLPRCASMSTKGLLATQAHQLGTSAVLKTVDPASLADDDLLVITEKFGKSRDLTTLRKRVEKLNA
ncbi:KAP family P-loop NTPase fold protein [Pseudomonas mosselii]|uniref:KAP family P-loop NTPase fold protein n=2 Tax=Pseudomonas TaxID=286 RepID=UPI00300D1C2D